MVKYTFYQIVTTGVGVVAICLLVALVPAYGEPSVERHSVTIRVSGLPDTASPTPRALGKTRSLEAFKQRYPWINLTAATGLELEGRASNITLMQIAGRIAPYVMHVNLGLLDSYVDQGFLAPLDEFVEQMSHEEKMRRAPQSIWDAVTRRGPPDGGVHIYALPNDLMVSAVFYRRGLFREAGLPDRVPKDWAELEQFARVLKKEKGLPILGFPKGWESSSITDFMRGTGAEVIAQDADGGWRCTFATPATAKAAVQYAKLIHMGWAYRDPADHRLRFDQNRIGMVVQYFSSMFVSSGRNPDLVGHGPLFQGPRGQPSSSIFCNMLGMFADIPSADDREAAWTYMRWQNGSEDLRIKVETFVKNGLGSVVSPHLLREFGFEEYVELGSEREAEILEQGLKYGQPAIHGPKIDQVMRELNKPVGEILNDSEIKHAILSGEIDQAESLALEHLKQAQRRMNERIYGTLNPEDRRNRNRVATAVAAIVMLAFVVLFVMVMRAFRSPQPLVGRGGRWQFAKYRWAYLILLPALGSVLIWQYYPLMRGTVMAFQDYRVMGGSQMVGMDNFAACLYDKAFWYSIWVSIKYAMIFLSIGFGAPIVLAILLQEAPFARILFRTIFYLPAVLTGIVVILLWKKFYHLDGVLNQIILFFTEWPPWVMLPSKLALVGVAATIAYQLAAKPLLKYPDLLSAAGIVIRIASLLAIIFLLGTVGWAQLKGHGLPGGIADSFRWFSRPWTFQPTAWLDNRNTALFACILPTIWAGMGPGCLIYLAALKTVPEEIYEAADVDGATTEQKILHVTIPGIKGLIIINFVGAFIGAFRSAGLILPMTGGGPMGTYNATEVVGLQIFYTAFFDLKFGLATAMAWILGAMLIGFTMLQLRKLSQMEFRTAEKTGV